MMFGQDQGLGNKRTHVGTLSHLPRNNVHIKASWWNDLSMLEGSQKFTDQVEGSLKAEDLEVTTKLVNSDFHS
jgi:hypothetical protein